MIHYVPLSELPPGFEVPDDLRAQFHYDAERKRLCFDGFMSKRTFDRLVCLSRDVQYLRSLEELFRICVPDEDTQSASHSTAIVVAVFALGILAAGGLSLLWFVSR